ncbi:Bug family tripartite tricarboxylate transporter substrate binding protein [Variovorax sp. PAMC26660]|uniref:Bug family tripartite tricarboxylate transporter substrate binding protein n=1 Tax=Variovorax sp. PAMC26660 TaxID=2762322 RepID=UPI00164DB5CB|nr:tripartite tricarboxylate transporter substrate-binding protein [Variovorax sp. PAMC26660]QNK71335.1 tripartite tricarboxylate transporter substrate binding protein [Variovorax sp. PAMC26660]
MHGMIANALAARTRLWVLGFLAALAPGLARASEAAVPEWPHARPITWIVGFPSGGTVDTQARMVARLLSRKTGQPVIVENKSGASGALALHAAAAAPADGYTLVSVAGPGFDGRDVPHLGNGLAPVALLAKGPMVLVASMANNPPADLQALLADMRRRPGAWSYASSGVGTPQHLAGELLNRMAGTSMLHVPYKGGAQAVGDVVSGQVPLGILGVMPLLPYIKANRLRVYAVTSATRLFGTLPQVPTMQEAGVPGYEICQWHALAVSDKVPSARVAQLNKWINEIMVSQAMKEPMQITGAMPGEGSPADVLSFAREEDRKWRAFARSASIAVAD